MNLYILLINTLRVMGFGLISPPPAVCICLVTKWLVLVHLTSIDKYCICCIALICFDVGLVCCFVFCNQLTSYAFWHISSG